MGHKIFISYKYHDTNVYNEVDHHLFEESRRKRCITPRQYVDVLAEYLDEHSPHYCKAEDDNNDLSKLSEDQIWEILKDKIFDSTLTIVIISPNMKDDSKRDRDQWIPWEIKYSLDRNNRHDSLGNTVISNTNAMLAIVLPDINNDYSYYFEQKTCCSSGCRLNKTNKLFKILQNNTFNIKEPDSYNCKEKDTIYRGKQHSYIPFYKWCDVNTKEKLEEVIKHAYTIQNSMKNYNICHEID